jgi:aminoglycoside 6-adenylyltransferase
MIEAISAWAAARADVHAALLVGSQARAEVPADRWSDIDIVLFVDDPSAYAADAGWVADLGRPLLTFLEPTAVGGFVERRVLYDSGQDVDFALLPAAAIEHIAEAPESAQVLGRGHRVLVDKVGLELSPPPHSLSPPTEADFVQLTNDFWYHAVLAMRKLRRGEVWVAKQSCDGYLKALTVDLLAWNTRAADPATDTWHRGRFLERWADEASLRELRDAYAAYDAGSVERAIWSTVELFERLEHQCADRLGFARPVPDDEVRLLLRAV